jgi:hypothetical protein
MTFDEGQGVFRVFPPMTSHGSAISNNVFCRPVLAFSFDQASSSLSHATRRGGLSACASAVGGSTGRSDQGCVNRLSSGPGITPSCPVRDANRRIG